MTDGLIWVLVAFGVLIDPTPTYRPDPLPRSPAVVVQDEPEGQATSRWASVVPCESGGDPTVFSPTGKYWGLYQFDLTTWVAHGGDPDAWGNAPAEVQHLIADRVEYDAWPNC